jgi:putative ABC transport system permease protein
MVALQVIVGLVAVAGLPVLVLLALDGLLGGLRRVIPGGTPRFYLLMLQRSLLRHLLRTTLTASALTILVLVVLAVWSVLWSLDQVTREKAAERKFIVRAKHYVPSEMPLAYADRLARECRELPAELRPGDDDMMTWQVYLGTVDPTKRTRENFILVYALEPDKLVTMMDVLDDVPPDQDREFRQVVAKLAANRRGAILGHEKLAALNKQVGERFKVTSFNHPGIDLEFEIVGLFPPGRYERNAAMDRDYLNNALSDFERRTGEKHPMLKRTLNLFWVRVPSHEAAEALAARIEDPARFADPPLTMETLSSGITMYVESYGDLIWTLRWLLVPAALVSMALLAANTVSINTRERATEVAVLKVLGYPPSAVAAIIIGEALLIGLVCGVACPVLMYVAVNEFLGGVRLSETAASFAIFFIPINTFWWGPAVGAGTALLGSIGPTYSACRVQVAEVFGKVQ